MAPIAQSSERGYLEEAVLERNLEEQGRFRQVKAHRRGTGTSVGKGSEARPGLLDLGTYGIMSRCFWLEQRMLWGAEGREGPARGVLESQKKGAGPQAQF